MAATNQKCPVCRWEIKEDQKRIEVQGRIIIVCCDDCAQKVRANPQKYIKAG